jgi:hypothetical protein
MNMVSFRPPVTLVAVGAALLTAAGLVSAGAVGAERPSAPATGPWQIGTIAGGPGGPGPARKLAGGACALASTGGYLYSTGLAPGASVGVHVVRRIGVRAGWVTTAVGTGLFTFAMARGLAVSPQDGAPAAQTTVGYSCGLAVDQHGNVIYTDYDLGLVQVLATSSGTYFGRAMTTGHVYTIGGGGSSSYPAADGGPARSAQLAEPAGVTVDASGNVIFDDSDHSAIRLIAATSGSFYGQQVTAGDIYTVAGGHYGEGPFGVPATSSALMLTDSGGEYPGIQPWPVVTVDHFGDIVIAEGGGNDGYGAVAVVAAASGTFYGQPMTAGDIYVLAGGGQHLGDGIPGQQAALCTPSGVGVDHAGNILVTDAYPGCHRVYVIAASTGQSYGRSMQAGYIYVIAGTGKGGSAGNGGPARQAEFSGPEGVVIDSAGNIVLADGFNTGYGDSPENDWLRVIAEGDGNFYGRRMTVGNIYTISGQRGWSFFGDGGPAGRALFDTYSISNTTIDTGLAVDKAGDVAFSDMANRRVRFIPAASGIRFGQTMTAGYIYTIGGDGYQGYRGNGGPASRARFSEVSGVAFDAAGNVLLTDTLNHRVRVVAARSCRCYGQAMAADHIYSIAGNGQAGYSGDEGPAARARVGNPAAIVIDQHGNVIFTESDVPKYGINFTKRIRVIAARSGSFYGRHMTAGDIYTIRKVWAFGLTVDAAGNVIASGVQRSRLVGDGYYNTVQVVVLPARRGHFYGLAMVPGRAYPIAGRTWFQLVGSGAEPASPDGGRALRTVIRSDGVAVDKNGNVIIADHSYPKGVSGRGPFNPGERIRVVAVRTGTFYGIAMTAGHIYTIAGYGGTTVGDGGPPLQAAFADPTGIAVAPSGAILILDTNRIRVIYR